VDPARNRQLMALDEGRRSSVYKDSLGYETIGVGHCVDPRLSCGLPEPIIDALLDYDLAEAETVARKYCTTFDALSDARQFVMLSMAFVLKHRMQHFGPTLGLVAQGQWAEAAAHLRGSLWAKQAPKRVERLAKMLEMGDWL